MVDRGLLQLIRLEVSLFGRRAAGLPCLAEVDPAVLKAHVERLFYGGEIAGACRLGADGLEIEIHGLTPYGLLEMHAHRAREEGAGRAGRRAGRARGA